jgi:renalase
MNNGNQNVAVIGAGIAGATCARALADDGWSVALFDKSRGVGGRMATRRVEIDGANGAKHTVRFDHGAPGFDATSPEFASFIELAARNDLLTQWTPRAEKTGAADKSLMWVPFPDMPSICRALTTDLPVRTNCAIDALRPNAGGWLLESAGVTVADGFSHVVVAIPAPQASNLLRSHKSVFAAHSANMLMLPCWTMMAVTNEPSPSVDWEIAHPSASLLAQIIRNDAKPGRERIAGLAQWVIHATSKWSQAHLELSPGEASSALQSAFADWLDGPLTYRYASAHRWRYALPPQRASITEPFLWDNSLQIGICGDALGGNGVEGAWRSARALSDFLINKVDGSQARSHVVSSSLAQTRTQ